MATTKANLNYATNTVEMEVLGEKVSIAKDNIMQSYCVEECSFVDFIDPLVYETYLQTTTRDKLEAA